MADIATIISGKKHAATIIEKMANAIKHIQEKHQFTPGLAVVIVGEDPASKVYVNSKAKRAREIGMNSFKHRLPEDTSEQDLLMLIEKLNNDASVHGILVQLPLPKHINEHKVINAISLAKDVDGFSSLNAGNLLIGQKAFIPCTPLGCLLLLQEYFGDLSGKDAVVIGRSNIVGKPMALLLLHAHCTVSILHSRTQDIESACQRADIIVAAVGKPHFVKANWVKKGAVVIDVGINRIEDSHGNKKLVGDVDFDPVSKKSAAITPVPGGVGPMTIACLLRNTIQAACQIHNIPTPEID